MSFKTELHDSLPASEEYVEEEIKYTNPSLHKIITPLTYFKDMYGFIYYAHACVVYRGVRGLRATHVYAPDPSGNRISLEDGKKYNKVIFHGIGYEFDLIKEKMLDEAFKRLAGLVKKNEVLGESFLFVPLSEVERYYSPKESLKNITANNFKHKTLSVDSLNKVHATLKILNDNGIPSDSIGLYGGLQCYLVRDLKKQVKDIDVVIEGIRHYDRIVQLSRGNEVNPKLLEANTLKNPRAALAAVRRGELSQFRVPYLTKLVCDVRLARTGNDPNSCVELSVFEDRFQLVTIKAKVTRADESLSLPYSFEVETKEGRKMTISGRYYEFTGAATIGDTIEAKGLKISDTDILLANEGHYIVTVERG